MHKREMYKREMHKREMHKREMHKREMHKIVFSSALSESYYRDLQEMLFLNGNQSKVADDIVDKIERYGEPAIRRINNRLQITLKSETPTQTLFVLNRMEQDDELVGTVIYTRESDTLVMLYVAVREDYCTHGNKQDHLLFFRIVSQLRSIGRRIKGVSSIRVLKRANGSRYRHVSLSVT